MARSVSEPWPVYDDVGSGPSVHQTSDWYAYTGRHTAPKAEVLRGRCTCGWRGAETYPVDWDDVDRRAPYLHDTSGPERDWERHMDEVAAGAPAMPEDVEVLVRTLRDRIVDIEGDDPLTALRIAVVLEAVALPAGEYAAREAARKHSEREIAVALGMTEDAASSRLRRYRWSRSW
ncbi:hypothetical protein [Streptomyces sp. NPDC090025]|uniref:hypothetical protein n=1 Tax=Streptomyces sp. NPDC090025 TaxID=3365922 RepID=UPI003836E7B0